MTKKREKRVMPERIPDTPKNVAAAILSSPPRKPDQWKYLKSK